MSYVCTLIVPCYNEAQRLRPASFLSFAFAHRAVKFVFVDDGSTDGTQSILAEAVRRIPDQAMIVALPGNMGKAEAVRRGVLEGVSQKCEFFGYWDADLATPLSATDLLLARLTADTTLDLAMGSRIRMLGTNIVRSPWRHYVGRAIGTAISLALNAPVYDTQCGAKLFRNSALVKRVFESPFISRWLFDVEILARLMSQQNQRGSHVAEVPLPEWIDVAGSKVSFAAGAKSLCELIQIAYVYRRNVASTRIQSSARLKLTSEQLST